MPPVTFRISKDISDYLRFADDRLADALPASEGLATKIRGEVENWKFTRMSVGAVAVDSQLEFGGAAFLRHNRSKASNHCIRPTSTHAVFLLHGSTQVSTLRVSEWLYEKTFGHPYFLAFICRDLWSQYHAQPFSNPAHLWQDAFSRLERGKFTTDLAQLSD